ncbi:hypothetical protein LSH36_330g10001 [Paralvinella palmiformis]|uniref:Uncharacterized protein n=1 Tax=Paralvinella palmiformis TaxID=53620 RepID=A0AAD9JG98_9ANNE|nr:hypothetical protein LSH36_330g10001 [Paralvinella palmiformis]
MSKKLLQPMVIDANVERQEIEVKQALYYNKHARDLKPLEEGDVVRLKPFQLCGDNVWIKGATIRRLDERSYEVESPSGTLCTNRAPHLCMTNEPSPLITEWAMHAEVNQ